MSPNPRIFEDVQKWIEKLDLPVKITAGAVSNYVYRLKYGRAETVAMAIMALYSGNPMALMGLGSMGGMGGGTAAWAAAMAAWEWAAWVWRLRRWLWGMGGGYGGMGVGGYGGGYGGMGGGYGGGGYGGGGWRLWRRLSE